MADASVPELATGAVLVRSEKMPEGSETCQGFDFDQKEMTLDAVMKAALHTGFQATNMGLAVDEINRMIRWRLVDEPVKEGDDITDPAERAKVKCTIFFSFTSNMISSGVREVIRFLVMHNMVDVIVTTGGAIEEDFLKCFNPHFMGDFRLRGKDLRVKGHNRIGNLIVPNLNYCAFEDWFRPLLHKMHDEQEKDGVTWTPSRMIHRMGREIDNPESVWYWAAKNDIPVFCPAITDGSVGDMIYFHSYKRPGFILDIAGDIRGINDKALQAKKTGMLILGGGLVKHHVCNANLMRNGADFSVFINTGHEFDGSDSGARPDEAISWGKIRLTAQPVKVYAEATLIFPLIVSQTFAKHGERLAAHTEELRAALEAKAAAEAEKAAAGGEEEQEDGAAAAAAAPAAGGGEA